MKATRRFRRVATGSWALAALVVASCAGDRAGRERPGADPLESPEYRAYRDEARALYARGELREALKKAVRALNAAPLAREPYESMSGLYVELGRDGEAIEFFALAAKQFPDSAQAPLYGGVHQFRVGNWDRALELYEEAARLDPDDPEPPFRRGVILQAQADFEGALAAFRRSLELHPESPTTFVRVARLERIIGDYDAALATVTRGLERNPDSADLHHARGQLLARRGNEATAEGALRRALSLDPKHRDAHHDLGRLLRRDGREEEGLRHERQAARLTDFLQLRQSLSGALATRPGDPAVPLALGELHLTEGNLDEALRWLDRAQAQGGPPERIAASRAEALFGLQRLAEGDRALAARGGGDRDAAGRAALARAARHAATGDVAATVQAVEQALAAGPDEREFLRRAADLCARAGLADRERELLERAVLAPALDETTLR